MGDLVTTTKGLMDADALERRAGVQEDENERAVWVEYWDGDELVHRSVDLTLKRGIFADGVTANFGD